MRKTKKVSSESVTELNPDSPPGISLPSTFKNKKDEAIIKHWLRLSSNGLVGWGLISRVAYDLRLSTKRVEQCAKKANLLQEAKAIKQEVKNEIFRDKVPLLKDIVNLSLNSVKEFLTELAQTPERLHALSLIEVKNLASIGVDLNEMLRLEMGQSTQNIEVVQYSYNETKVMLEDLKKIDPVFEYPELDDVEEAN